MTAQFFSQSDEIAYLKRQLATAETRLEQAQSFVFDLRCLAARKGGRGLWIKEEDRSGMRAAIWGKKDELGEWVLIKAEDVPEPTRPPLAPLACDVFSELGLSPTLSSSLSKRFPPELFYHLVEYTSKSTNSTLCLVSSSIRAIVSPLLYRSMMVTSPAQLAPFISDPRDRLVSLDRSLTLSQVRFLELTVKSGSLTLQDQADACYTPVLLPRLSNLTLHLDECDIGPDEDEPIGATDVPSLKCAATFLSYLNPLSLTISHKAHH